MALYYDDAPESTWHDGERWTLTGAEGEWTDEEQWQREAPDRESYPVPDGDGPPDTLGGSLLPGWDDDYPL